MPLFSEQSMLLGDFELDDLTETSGTIALFIIFTVFGVIILLNVLIAIISDSYERATMSGTLLFGRARVLYVAQNEALERFLQPRGQPGSTSAYAALDTENSRHKKARQATRWTMLLAIVGTAIYALLFMVGLCITLAQNESWFSFCLGKLSCIMEDVHARTSHFS